MVERNRLAIRDFLVWPASSGRQAKQLKRWRTICYILPICWKHILCTWAEITGWKLVDMYVALIFLGGNVVRRYCALLVENTDRQDIGQNFACRSENNSPNPHRKRVLRVSKTVRRQIGQNSACRTPEQMQLIIPARSKPPTKCKSSGQWCSLLLH